MSRTQLGFLSMMTASTAYALLPVFTQPLYDAGMTAVDIALWRYAVAAPLFWLMAWILARRSPPPADGRRPLPRAGLIVLGSLLAAAALTAFLGLSRIPAGTYVVIFYTYPAMVALIALFLGDRLSGWGWLAVALTLVGVALTAPNTSDGLSGDSAAGVLLALINALVVAVYFVLNSWLLRGHQALATAGALTCTGALITLAIIALFSGTNAPPTPTAALSLLGLATISTIVPVFCLNKGIQLLGPARAAIVGAFEPLLTALLAMIFLGQRMEPVQWLGGVVIVSAVIILQTRGRAASSAPAAPAPVDEPAAG